MLKLEGSRPAPTEQQIAYSTNNTLNFNLNKSTDTRKPTSVQIAQKKNARKGCERRNTRLKYKKLVTPKEQCSSAFANTCKENTERKPLLNIALSRNKRLLTHLNSNDKKNSFSPFTTDCTEKKLIPSEFFGLGATTARLKSRADRENDCEYLTVSVPAQEYESRESNVAMQGILQEQLDSIKFKLQSMQEESGSYQKRNSKMETGSKTLDKGELLECPFRTVSRFTDNGFGGTTGEGPLGDALSGLTGDKMTSTYAPSAGGGLEQGKTLWNVDFAQNTIGPRSE